MTENFNKKIRFIDCGANIGQSAEWAFKIFQNYDVHVDCFEPLPLNLEKIREKHSVNGRVTIHDFAVSTSDGEMHFYCQNHGVRTGSSLVKGKIGASLDDVILVKTIDLANWIKENRNEDEEMILKLDIEGAEYSVIPHLIDNGIHEFIKIWLVEFHGTKISMSEKDTHLESRLTRTVTHLIDWSRPARAEEAIKALFKK